MKKNNSDVYQSAEGRRLLHNLYRKHLLALDVPLSEQMVETNFGDTHVMHYGSPSGIPVLCFCGAWITNPLGMRPFIEGLDLTRLRLVVPDVPGGLGFSAERRLHASKGEYGQWAFQVMDTLGMRECSVLGYSFGAPLALQLCREALLCVRRLLLVQPAGITKGASSKVEKLMRLSGKEETQLTQELLKKSLTPMLSFEHDELIEMTKMLFLHAKVTKGDWKELRKKDLNKFRAPVGLIADPSDDLFPGEEIVKKARKLIPFLEMSNLTHLGCHYGLFKNDTQTQEVMQSINDFLLRGA
ncbi:alpha/beta fold hydrolase [Tannerella sp.]|uniref:alpha/beta fold hydrolase n=1 Tax=Tannerella sp. TaxID=2382127 RepID=UPI0026DCDF78|nr:hypothetical protein [Tannerella sp.]MDO4704386.1 hypothetical protein [Tannerella sp.]